MLQKTKNIRDSLRKNLSGSMLASGQIDDLTQRCFPRDDFEGPKVGDNKDRRMWRCIHQLFEGRGHRCNAMLSQLDLAFADPKLTKQFYHNEKMNEAVSAFLTEDVPSKEHLIAFQIARKILMKDIKVTKLKQTELNAETLFDLLKRNTSAGAVGPGKKSKGDNPQRILSMASDIKQAIAQGNRSQRRHPEIWVPAMMFHRGQLSNLVKNREYTHAFKMKDRAVWGLDGGTVAVEAQHAKPLANHLMERWRSYAGGKTPDELRETIRVDRLYTNYWYSIDYSGYDQRVPAWLIRSVFSIIKLFFDESTWAELDWECDNFVNTRLLLPGGDVVVKHKGIASGSEFTQIVGSMCNELMILTYAVSKVMKRLGRKAPEAQVVEEARRIFRGDSRVWLRMHVMGDDNLFFTGEKFDLKEFSGYVKAVFGAVVNPEKCSCGETRKESPEFLKRAWTYQGEYRDLLEICIGLICNEYPRTYDHYTPWHILYGTYCTYQAAFEPYVHESEILVRIGDIRTLLSLEKGDRPGSFEAYGDKANEWLYRRAKTAWPPEMVRPVA